MHPPLTYTGLISFSHDISQHDPNTNTLADHIHTGIISTHLHKAITKANGRTIKHTKQNQMTKNNITERYKATAYTPLIDAWLAYTTRADSNNLKTFLAHLLLRL